MPVKPLVKYHARNVYQEQFYLFILHLDYLKFNKKRRL